MYAEGIAACISKLAPYESDFWFFSVDEPTFKLWYIESGNLDGCWFIGDL